jgi:alkyl hydroperoxide reductase subunit F
MRQYNSGSLGEITMKDLIIVGGGPSGLTAAIYAIRKRLDVLLISPDLGGKTNWRMYLPDNMDHYQVINGDEIVSRFKSQIEYLEFSRKTEVCEKVEAIQGGYAVTTREGNRYEARAVILATGTIPAKLNVPGEDQYRLHGLAYSAVSYAPTFINRVVAVVGDGELAVRSALELAQGARQVYFILPASSILENALGEKVKTAQNISILEGYAVKEIKGDGSYARSIVIAKDSKEDELAVDATFVEFNLKPNSECVAGLVALNDKKQVIVDCNTRTSQAGIFAAGDVTNTYAEQVLICIGEGAKAALSAYEYILSL